MDQLIVDDRNPIWEAIWESVHHDVIPIANEHTIDLPFVFPLFDPMGVYASMWKDENRVAFNAIRFHVRDQIGHYPYTGRVKDDEALKRLIKSRLVGDLSSVVFPDRVSGTVSVQGMDQFVGETDDDRRVYETNAWFANTIANLQSTRPEIGSRLPAD